MNSPPKPAPNTRPFLGVYFANCGVYGRLYRNQPKTYYSGHCPKCGKSLTVAIGAHGTDKRFFVAQCR